MRDDNGWRFERVYNLFHIRDIVRDGMPTQPFVTFTACVSAQAKRGAVVSAIGKIRQEMFIPTPGAMPFAMHKQQRRLFLFAVWRSVDDFQLHSFCVGDGVGWFNGNRLFARVDAGRDIAQAGDSMCLQEHVLNFAFQFFGCVKVSGHDDGGGPFETIVRLDLL